MKTSRFGGERVRPHALTPKSGVIPRQILKNLHQFARDGVKLLGHISGAQDGKVTFKPDLKENLAKAVNINSIIWAIGYTSDYSFVKLPVTDEDGFPIQKRGVTQYPGLYFVGTNWLSKRDSSSLLGMNEDVEYIVADMMK